MREKNHWFFKAPGSHFGRMGRDLKWYEEMQPKEYFLLVCTSVVEAAISGTSLTVQWLRLHAFNAGHLGSIPGSGTKIPYAIWCSQKKKKKKQPLVIKYQTSSIWRTSSLPRLCKLGTSCSRSMCIAVCHKPERWVLILRAEIDQYWPKFTVLAFPWKSQALYSLQSSKQVALDLVSAIFV